MPKKRPFKHKKKHLKSPYFGVWLLWNGPHVYKTDVLTWQRGRVLNFGWRHLWMLLTESILRSFLQVISKQKLVVTWLTSFPCRHIACKWLPQPLSTEQTSPHPKTKQARSKHGKILAVFFISASSLVLGFLDFEPFRQAYFERLFWGFLFAC